MNPGAPEVAIDLRLLDASGIGTYLRSLVPRLIATDRGTEYVLLGDLEALGRHGLGTRHGARRVPARAPIYSVAEQWELWRRLPTGAALFWAPHYNIPLLHRGRLLVTIHDVMHLARPEYFRGAHRKAYVRLMFSALRRKADQVICVSRFTADELIRHVGIEAARITVIPEGVDPSWFVADGAGEMPHPRPYLLFVGNVKPHKNLARLLQAFEALIPDVPHDLVIVGKREGFITGDPRAEQHATKLDGRVQFTGYLPDRQLQDYVRHADALVVPSLYEGFGLPPLEAMASGCPVIASGVASLPEVCGDAALYCDPLDPADIAAKLRRLLRDGALRAELRERGREHARSFDWDHCARDTRAVVHALVDR